MLSPQEALQEWLVIITVVISEKMMPESCFSGLLSFAKLRKKGLSFRENSRRIKNKTRADRGNSLRGKCGRKEGMILYARKVKEERMGQNWDKERSRDQQQPVTSEFCPMERPERETGAGVCKLHSGWLANKVLNHSLRPRQKRTCDLAPNPQHSCYQLEDYPRSKRFREERI